MKHVSILLFLASIISLLLESCSSGSKSDFSKISKDGWYAGETEKGSMLYLRFTQTSDDAGNGICFIENGKAIVSSGTFVADKNGLEFTIQNQTTNLGGSWQIDSLRAEIKTDRENKLILFNFEPQYIIPKTQNRYNESVFDSASRTEVKYSKASGFYSTKPVKDMNAKSYPTIISEVINGIANNLFAEDLDLKMDIYQPRNDTLQKRPLLVLIHGGAFIVGDKRDDFQVKLANRYAKMGYVVASINYRMGYIFLPNAYSNLERCIYKAVQDSRSAIRWLKKNSKKYRIDPNYIFVAGNSAGGFIALKTAFMNNSEAYPSTEGNLFMLQDDLGCLDCSGEYRNEKFKIRGIVNMWGALTHIDMLDKDEKTPLLLIHGDSDRIVPYDYNYPFRNIDENFTAFFMNKVYGSKKIHERAQSFGFTSKLITISNGAHEPQVDDENKYTPQFGIITHSIDSFLVNLLGRDSIAIEGKTSISTNSQTTLYSIKNYKKGSMVYWKIEGGCIIENRIDKGFVRVVWFKNANKHSIKAVEITQNGKNAYSPLVEILLK